MFAVSERCFSFDMFKAVFIKKNFLCNHKNDLYGWNNDIYDNVITAKGSIY